MHPPPRPASSFEWLKPWAGVCGEGGALMVEVTGLCLRPGTRQGQEEDLRQAAVEQGLSPRGGSGNKPCEVTLEAQSGVHQLHCPQTPSLKPPTNLLTSFPDNGPLRAVLTPGSDGSAPPNTGGTGGLAKCGCRPLGSVLSKATHSWTEGEPLGDTRPPAGEEASWQLIVFLWVLCDSEEAS